MHIRFFVLFSLFPDFYTKKYYVPATHKAVVLLMSIKDGFDDLILL